MKDVHSFWAEILGARGPQWMIIVALRDLDHGEGAPISAVAAATQLDPTFVATQSRRLEKRGFVRRNGLVGAGVVSLSLTDKARKHLADFDALQKPAGPASSQLPQDGR